MTLFRKSLTHQIAGRAQRVAGAMTHDRTREYTGVARQYVGDAGMAVARAGRQVRRHPRTALAVGAGIGVAALAAAWLFARRRPAPEQERDEHDPFHDDAVHDQDDGVVPGETGLY